MNSPNFPRLKLFDEQTSATKSTTVTRTDAPASAAPSAPSVDDLQRELERTRRALLRREAELAAGVPLVPQAQPQRHLSERLEAVLKGVAEAIGCTAAGVYLLDAATTELKLRSCWGMPFERYLEPPRPLHAAVADVEALAGHAVVLEDATNYASWNLPEAGCRAAVCVPVSSPTVPLGTLWLFADGPREFTDQEVNIVEIGAGRIASDLEREMLMTETRDTARLRRAWDDAGYRREARTPRITPLVDDWEIAGRMFSVDGGFAEFYDWRVTDHGGLAAAVGAVEQHDFAAALDVETLRTAWRAHARYAGDVGRLLEFVNEELWTGSSEPSPGHLITLQTLSPSAVVLASAGRVGAAILGPGKVERVNLTALPLGTEPDVRYLATAAAPEVGEVLVASNDARLIDRLVAGGVEAFTKRPVGTSASRRLDQFAEWLEADEGMAGALIVLRRKA